MMFLLVGRIRILSGAALVLTLASTLNAQALPTQMRGAAYARTASTLNPTQNVAAPAYSVGYQAYNASPTISPYLNLTRENEEGISNYHSLVRPQLDARRQSAQYQQNLMRLQSQLRTPQAIQPGAINQPRITGHQKRFLSYSHYYPGLQRR